jgi:eukaryotic-like serine/threonine-protein kinase
MSPDRTQLSEALHDRYLVEREVGAGGMATVYLARDRKHDRLVALKVLRPELSAAMGPERFTREIRFVAQFNHPHILSLYDSGEIHGFLYYVMPYVEGESLRDRLSREKQLPIQDAIRVLREVADALAYSHARGVVHRDIKPANVMLSGKHAMVTDFGVAKAVSAASVHEKATTVGIALGTPQYMSPEQAMGETNVDHRADIYALGILAYEMLTGRLPFDAHTPQAMLAAHVMETPIPVQQLRPGVPPALAEVIMRCLAKNPADRWQSTDELSGRLETMELTPSGGLTPTDTRPLASTSVRPVRPGRRRAPVAAAALALAAALGGGGFWAAGKLSASERIDRIGVMPIEDISGRDSLFSAAMHDALTNSLVRINVTGVVPRSAMLRYRDGARSTREIARELDLDAIVEATVFRAGDVMRINVQLTSPTTTRSLWSDTYERDVSNVLAAQTEVVEQISAGIGSTLSAGRQTGERK